MSELSDQEISQLERLRDNFEAGGEDSLTDWEIEFVEDILEKFDEYADNTYLSEKQWAVIMRILDKMDLG